MTSESPSEVSRPPSTLSQIKARVWIVSTVVLTGLNIWQCNATTQAREYARIREHPVVSIYRVIMSLDDIENIRRCVERGVSFSHIPNPAFLDTIDLSRLQGQKGRFVEFVVIHNHSDIPLSRLQLFVQGGNKPPMQVSQLNPKSTLLVPTSIIDEVSGEHRAVCEVSSASYSFSLGGHVSEGQVAVPSRGREMVVFEVGLGPIGKITPNLDNP